MLYTFVVIVCVSAHPCTDAKAAKVMRGNPGGQFTCDARLAEFKDRLNGLPKFKARAHARCDWHVEDRA